MNIEEVTLAIGISIFVFNIVFFLWLDRKHRQLKKQREKGEPEGSGNWAVLSPPLSSR
ncbi:hypothetical protein ES702_01422 [subsurface metagenome]